MFRAKVSAFRDEEQSRGGYDGNEVVLLETGFCASPVQVSTVVTSALETMTHLMNNGLSITTVFRKNERGSRNWQSHPTRYYGSGFEGFILYVQSVYIKFGTVEIDDKSGRLAGGRILIFPWFYRNGVCGIPAYAEMKRRLRWV